MTFQIEGRGWAKAHTYFSHVVTTSIVVTLEYQVRGQPRQEVSLGDRQREGQQSQTCLQKLRLHSADKKPMPSLKQNEVVAFMKLLMRLWGLVSLGLGFPGGLDSYMSITLLIS